MLDIIPNILLYCDVETIEKVCLLTNLNLTKSFWLNKLRFDNYDVLDVYNVEDFKRLKLCENQAKKILFISQLENNHGRYEFNNKECDIVHYFNEVIKEYKTAEDYWNADINNNGNVKVYNNCYNCIITKLEKEKIDQYKVIPRILTEIINFVDDNF